MCFGAFPWPSEVVSEVIKVGKGISIGWFAFGALSSVLVEENIVVGPILDW